MSKKHRKKYPREHFVYIGHDKPSTGTRADEKGDIEVYVPGEDWQKPKYSWSEISYERGSGRTKRTAFVPNKFADFPEEYAVTHDWLFVVDTNSVDDIAVTCSTQFTSQRMQNGDIEFRRRAIVLSFFTATDVHPEKVGISIILQSVREYGSKEGKYLVVTDHDIGKLDDFNQRRKPIWQDIYVPVGTTLMYASADATNKNDSLLNGMIHECDSLAKKHLTELITTDSTSFGPASIARREITEKPKSWVFPQNPGST